MNEPVSPGDTTVRLRSTWPLPPSERGEEGLRPEQVGPYPIEETLGQGGMGEVFLARDPVLDRPIALKRIRADKRHLDELRARFQLEARVTARLQHPAIIPVYAFAGEGDELYYTMRPVEGMSLAELLRRLRAGDATSNAAWRLPRLLRLFLQAANAVAFAHSKGVVHRDLKPGNIMLGRFEEVLVLDWGMAKVLPGANPSARRAVYEGALDLDTASNLLVGTPAYIAPELFDKRPASERSDVFSLGVILYELLCLRLPWRSRDLRELREEMRRRPQPPQAQPARSFPPRLGDIALRALHPDPGKRYQNVTSFAEAVAAALEGRAIWRRVATPAGTWRMSGGRVVLEDGALVLRPRGAGEGFRYLYSERFRDNVRVEFELYTQRGRPELEVWLNARGARDDGSAPQSYRLGVSGGKRRMLALLRSGRDVAGARAPDLTQKRWHKVVASREEHRVSLRIDGEEIYAYTDPIPLGPGLVGLAGKGHSLRLRNLAVHARGAGLTVSCLAVPDAFFNRRLFEDARYRYERIAANHPGRREGRLAGFRAGLCLLEMARAEREGELRAMLLEEAQQYFAERAEDEGGSLPWLGCAMVAAERGQPALKHEALAEALANGNDPHLTTAREWLLATLHSLEFEQRRSIAELLPLAIEHCADTWGLRLVLQIVRDVRSQWEMPSFMAARLQGSPSQPTWRAQARLYFGFWSARPLVVERACVELVQAGLARSAHVGDAFFALLELGASERARSLLAGCRLALAAKAEASAQLGATLRACEAVCHALDGDDERARTLLAATLASTADESGRVPRGSRRVGNSARLWLARLAASRGGCGAALEMLRPHDAQDGFAREHRAWFLLDAGDVERAEKELGFFVRRKLHRHGRNLANFLVGTCWLASGRSLEATELFAGLRVRPLPRTWTLGSLIASGRWNEDRLRAWLAQAFPWEKHQLRLQLALLGRLCPGRDGARYAALAASIQTELRLAPDLRTSLPGLAALRAEKPEEGT